MITKRIMYIDYLKVVGLFLVILAHVNCPQYIMQLRNFDVPLLVVISGYLASKSFVSGDNLNYYWKRLQRLAFPTWIFVFIFFIIQSVVYVKPNVSDIFKALTFQRDSSMLGMLWVIWVYLICSFLVPIISKIGYNKKNSIIIIIIYLLYELACTQTSLIQNRIVYVTFLTIIPWGTLTYFAFYFDEIKNNQKKLIVLAGLIIFFISASVLLYNKGLFITTNEYKYPARLYYFSYAIPITIILISLFKRINFKKNKIICFISGSSLWIYLWHILFLYLVKSIIVDDSLWYIQYLCIVILSVMVTFFQNIVVNYLISVHKLKFLKVFQG